MNNWVNVYIYMYKKEVESLAVAVFSNLIAFLIPDFKVIVDDFCYNTHQNKKREWNITFFPLLLNKNHIFSRVLVRWQGILWKKVEWDIVQIN